MKIAIAGKGGAGKTTLCALLARFFAAQGRPVLAVDADPNNCLGQALGLSEETLARITPLSEMKQLLAERAGTDQPGSFFSLNPQVDDLPERFRVQVEGISLFVMGSITQGGAGCICPESGVLKAVIRQLVEREEAAVLLDMEAGIEHLGRGTARFVDCLVIVVEPTWASVRTAERIAKLAGDLDLPPPLVVGNKVQDAAADFLREHLEGLELIGLLPFDERLLSGPGPVAPGPAFLQVVESIGERLLRCPRRMKE